MRLFSFFLHVGGGHAYAQESDADSASVPVAPETNHASAPAGEPAQPEETTGEAHVPTVAQCMDFHEAAQLRRREGHLREAEAALRKCAQTACPQMIVDDCAAWSKEVNEALPRVILRAHGNHGDIAVARVFVNEEEVAQRLSQKPLRIDPGTHRLRVELPDGQVRETQLILASGEPVRVLEFDFRKPQTKSSPTGPIQPVLHEAPRLVAVHPMRTPALVLAAFSAVSAGVAIGFGVDAVSEKNKADDLCAPNCDESVTRRVKTSATISDIAGVTAIAAAVGATVLFLWDPVRYAPEDSLALGALGTLDLNVAPGGGELSFKGLF